MFKTAILFSWSFGAYQIRFASIFESLNVRGRCRELLYIGGNSDCCSSRCRHSNLPTEEVSLKRTAFDTTAVRCCYLNLAHYCTSRHGENFSSVCQLTRTSKWNRVELEDPLYLHNRTWGIRTNSSSSSSSSEPSEWIYRSPWHILPSPQISSIWSSATAQCQFRNVFNIPPAPECGELLVSKYPFNLFVAFHNLSCVSSLLDIIKFDSRSLPCLIPDSCGRRTFAPQ